MKHIKFEVSNKTYFQFAAQVDNQVWNQIGDQVGNQP